VLLQDFLTADFGQISAIEKIDVIIINISNYVIRENAGPHTPMINSSTERAVQATTQAVRSQTKGTWVRLKARVKYKK
jgi:hypothetical protein